MSSAKPMSSISSASSSTTVDSASSASAPTPDVVQRAPRRGHDHVHAALQRPQLAPDRLAAVDRQHARAQVPAVAVDRLGDLHGQLARGHQHQRRGRRSDAARRAGAAAAAARTRRSCRCRSPPGPAGRGPPAGGDRLALDRRGLLVAEAGRARPAARRAGRGRRRSWRCRCSWLSIDRRAAVRLAHGRRIDPDRGALAGGGSPRRGVHAGGDARVGPAGPRRADARRRRGPHRGLGHRRLRRGRARRGGPGRPGRRPAAGGDLRHQRPAGRRRRPDVRRHRAGLRQRGRRPPALRAGAGRRSRPGGRSRWPRCSTGRPRARGWPCAPTARWARWATRRCWTPTSRARRAATSTRAARWCAATAPAARRSAPSCGSPSTPSRRRRGWWSSARSTSAPPSRAWPARSATA